MGDSSIFSIETKLIISSITFLIIFLILWIVSKKRIGFVWRLFISFFLTGCFYVGAYFYVDYIFNGDHYAKEDFNPVLWNSDHSGRLSMIDDLVDSEILLRKRQDEIIKLLGKPANIYDSLFYRTYELEMADVGISQSYIFLRINLENGVASKAEKISHPINW